MELFELGINGYELRPSMVPQFNVQVHIDKRKEFEEKLATFSINGQQIHCRLKGEGFYSLDIGFANMEDLSIQIQLMGRLIPLEHSGMENVKIQDRCGATAYHIPQGSLLIYTPGKNLNVKGMTGISTTEIAPSILRNFNVAVPGYMSKGITV